MDEIIHASRQENIPWHEFGLTIPLTYFLTYNLHVYPDQTPYSPNYILVGQLRRDFIVLPDGEAFLDVPGGNLLYAAAGLAIWENFPPPGLIARVGSDYPQEWLEDLKRRDFDTRGICTLPEPIDLRSFCAYPDFSTRVNKDPLKYFARLNQPFPKPLLGYHNNTALDSRNRLAPTSIRQNDLIPEYKGAIAAHICPLDFLSHNLIPAAFRQAGFTLITLDPSAGYMDPSFRDDIPLLINGLSAFLPSEDEIRALFLGRSSDLWEMAEAITSYGCEMVVIKRGELGQLVYDAHSRRRWEIPAYPVKPVDPTGVGDAFCGGFLIGYRQTYDPLQAALYGNISASLVIESHGPVYALESLTRLAYARLESLRQLVRKV